MRLLLVEDEAAIADFIQRGLEAEGYVVTWSRDGTDGEIRALSGDYDLVILDVLLPKQGGLEVLRSIRASAPDLPVILVTAQSEVEDKVRGLDLGASDYVTKPFAFEELLARVRSQLRRGDQQTASQLEAGDIRLDLQTRRVERDKREVRLTAREFELLAYMIRHPNQVLSRAQILNAVWGYDFDPGTNVLEVYVGYLRKKLAVSGRPVPIETVRSVGYRLATPDA